ncbi:MAG: hypothetical protein H0W20_14555 [Chthoniobacterales bacterium]|nr:hypothetical protein [Chthoniobacterales bacterium]
MPTPLVSVVIALWPDTAGGFACLSALEGQRDEHTQVIAAPACSPALELVRQFPWVEWLPPAPDALIPNLWSQGLAAARGEVVAITIAQFTPAADWVAQIRAAHGRLDSAGIGGAIDPPARGSAVAWATYFLRYSSLFKLDREQKVNDLAGDNASYKREAIAAHAKSIREGFWEQEFHRLVLAEGESLSFVPEIRVTQTASFGLRRFCAQRFSHGRHFGDDRVRGRSFLFRLAGIVAAPLIPVLLLAKILQRLRAKPSYLGSFLHSLPVLLLFIAAWATGEVWGYVTASSGETAALPAGKSYPT